MCECVLVGIVEKRVDKAGCPMSGGEGRMSDKRGRGKRASEMRSHVVEWKREGERARD